MTAPDDTGRADELLREAQEAARIREHQTDPAVIALAVERTRTAVDRFMWVGITLGLAFTTITVQEWGAAGAPAYGPDGQPNLTWWSMWLLGPLVEIPLLAILRGEQVASRYGITPGGWVRRARWGLLAAAYIMNCYAPWSSVLGGRWGFDDVLLHSVPPLAVLVAAEALTDLREALGAAITKAASARPPAPARPTPRKREQPAPPPPSDREPEDTPAPPGKGPLGDGRTLRQVGVDWAVEHWRDDLRPVEIGEALLAMGIDCSKGERSKIRDAAALVVAARTQNSHQDESDTVTAGANA